MVDDAAHKNTHKTQDPGLVGCYDVLVVLGSIEEEGATFLCNIGICQNTCYRG